VAATRPTCVRTGTEAQSLVPAAQDPDRCRRVRDPRGDRSRDRRRGPGSGRGPYRRRRCRDPGCNDHCDARLHDVDGGVPDSYQPTHGDPHDRGAEARASYHRPSPSPATGAEDHHPSTAAHHSRTAARADPQHPTTVVGHRPCRLVLLTCRSDRPHVGGDADEVHSQGRRGPGALAPRLGSKGRYRSGHASASAGDAEAYSVRTYTGPQVRISCGFLCHPPRRYTRAQFDQARLRPLPRQEFDRRSLILRAQTKRNSTAASRPRFGP
jgi:hypothetical protein